MVTADSEAVRRDFLSGFIPAGDPAADDPSAPEPFWDAVLADGETYPRLSMAFWTAKQRQASNLHEISYRACYKPQLPRHFIERLTRPGDRVYDPFSGRGTTALEAALLGRRVVANDINPLSELLARPRLSLPEPAAVAQRLEEIPRNGAPHDGLDPSHVGDVARGVGAEDEQVGELSARDRSNLLLTPDRRAPALRRGDEHLRGERPAACMASISA